MFSAFYPWYENLAADRLQAQESLQNYFLNAAYLPNQFGQLRIFFCMYIVLTDQGVKLRNLIYSKDLFNLKGWENLLSLKSLIVKIKDQKTNLLVSSFYFKIRNHPFCPLTAHIPISFSSPTVCMLIYDLLICIIRETQTVYLLNSK